MKHLLFLIVGSIILTCQAYGQELDKFINKDSVFKTMIKDLSEEKKVEFLKAYSFGNEQDKVFLIFMLSLPRSSKTLLIKNIDSNYTEINFLKTEYSKLVPQNCIVSIEYNPANKLINTHESIDLKIETTANRETTVSQKWKLEYDSKELNQMLKLVKWNYKTLKTIKELLVNAKCISIENGNGVTTIGFSRSGMGMYSYLLFNNDLTDKQTADYNDGCQYIFYKKNIVLAYDGGAAGPQCFPDR
jgi:hypothetical protein